MKSKLEAKVEVTSADHSRTVETHPPGYEAVTTKDKELKMSQKKNFDRYYGMRY